MSVENIAEVIEMSQATVKTYLKNKSDYEENGTLMRACGFIASKE